MMQQTIDIPTPARADTETVITALETAAIFRSKGDSREAMRWLQRAAESAGAAGDDQRALSLSRVAAELHAELDAVPEQKVTPYPPPPSTRSAPPSSSSLATGARQAARVAIAISTTKAGFFELRLLADGEAPRLGSSEALLIMVDPTSKLLAR